MTAKTFLRVRQNGWRKTDWSAPRFTSLRRTRQRPCSGKWNLRNAFFIATGLSTTPPTRFSSPGTWLPRNWNKATPGSTIGFSRTHPSGAAARRIGVQCRYISRMSYLYKRSNRFWHQLIKHDLVHGVWRPLVEMTRLRHLQFRRQAGGGHEPRPKCRPGCFRRCLKD